MKLHRVAIVVPLRSEPSLTDAEKLSLRHLDHFLGQYPKYFVSPPNVCLEREGFETVHFSSRYFGSVLAHNRLLISKKFYRAFSHYEFVLIYHPDALVFSDQLEYWCTRGFDLIAPPWIPGPDSPWLREPGVGCGGFSLRRVDAFLRLLGSQRRWREISAVEGKARFRVARLEGIRELLKKIYFYSYRLNGVKQESRAHVERGGNEDRFWWKRGQHYFPGLKIAPVETALEFGFEVNPAKCLQMNRGRIPFGCHAWEQYDRAFWEPLLLNERDEGSDALG